MTLMELIVVLAIIGLVVGVSVPSLVGYGENVRLNALVRQVVGLVSLARHAAMSAHTEHIVSIAPDQRQLTVLDADSGEALESRVSWPVSVSLAVEISGQPSEATQLAFRPSGALVTGRTTSLVLSTAKKRRTVTVMGATGAITVQ